MTMKKYEEQRDFEKEWFLETNVALFDEIDFSEATEEELEQIFSCYVEEISFSNCHFKNLNLCDKVFHQKITFLNCKFKGNTNFESATFKQETCFDGSEFNGIANFNKVDFNKKLSFRDIHTKPANSGYFYFRGISQYSNDLDLRNADFESEVSFRGRRFGDETYFINTKFRNKFWFTDCDFGRKMIIRPKFLCEGIKEIDMCYRILRELLNKCGYTLQAKLVEELEEKAFKKSYTSDAYENKITTDLLTTSEAAEYLHLEKNTLEQWRTKSPDRLPFIKIGRLVKYRLKDLEDFLKSNK